MIGIFESSSNLDRTQGKLWDVMKDSMSRIVNDLFSILKGQNYLYLGFFSSLSNSKPRKDQSDSDKIHLEVIGYLRD